MKEMKERKRIMSVGFLILSVVTILSGRLVTTFAEPILPAPIESPDVSEDTEEVIVRLGDDSGEEENYGYIPYTGLLEAPDLDPVPGLDRAITFPSKLDPRKTTAVTSVKNQYQTGSCWAHAILAASESSLIKKGQTNNSIDLSEMHLVYFFYSQPQDPLGNISNDKLTFTPDTMASRMNRGGNLVNTVWHMASGSGPVLQNETPSITSTTHLDTSTRLNASTRNNRVYSLKEAKITPFSYENRDAIKQLITEYGGVAISYYCDQDWEKVAGDTIAYYNPNINYGNHAVEIVGWDDNYSVSNFAYSVQGDRAKYAGAWLCKNSWGTGSDRRDGFFWLSYDTTVIAAECVAFSYENNTKYMNIYQYDGTKIGGYYTGGNRTYANVYTAKGNPGGYEVIDAVGLGVGANGSYHIKVYVNPVIKDGKLLSYDYVSQTKDFTSVYQGYYTVPLDDPIYVNQGERFAVAVTVDGESKLFCSDSDASGGNSECKEEDIRLPGQSYYISGTYWTDNQAYGTPRIKALTNPLGKITTPVTITLSESKLTLKHFGSKGETRQLKATLSPQNAVGGVRYFSSDDSVATVSSSGLVTAMNSGSCTIYAKYIDGTTAGCDVTVEDYRKLDVECELDREPWNGEGHVFTVRDSEGNVYENHAYVPLGEYAIYDNGEDTGKSITIYSTSDRNVFTLCYLTYKFYDYDGSLLHSQVGLQTKVPEYKGVIPSRPDDAEYTYTFSGWTPYLSSGTQKYTAKYIQTAKPQRITIEVRKNSYIWNTADAPKIELVSATDSTKIYQNGEAAPAGKYYIIADGKKTKYSVTTTEKLEYFETLDFYTATFFSDDGGELLQRKAYLPGDVPTYDGDIPTKASDGTYHYTFSGWSKAIEPMGTKAVEYTACYTKSYCDRYAKVSATLDGEKVDERISLYETDLTTSETEYLGIYENGSMVPVGLYELYLDTLSIGRYIVVSPGKDYRNSVELFTVVFENDDHTVLQKNYVVSGDVAEYDGDIPKKATDAAYCYTFDTWSSEMTGITEKTTYTALYSKTALPQKVSMQCSLSSNDIPTEATVDLSLHSIEDETQIYKNGECVPIGDYAVYVNGRDAKHRITVCLGETYEETLQFYLIRFVDEVSGQLLKEEYYMEGELPAIEEDLLYPYEDNDDCRYEILGWDAAFEEVSESKTYLFQGSAIPIVRELQITCYLNDVVWDPSENPEDDISNAPQTQAIHIPTQEAFENHSDNLPVGEYEIWVNSRNSGVTFEVKSDSGLCRCDLNFYTVTFEDDMGNVLQSQICLQNELPVFEGEVPHKENTDQVCYQFLGWENEISNATNKATYKAVFSQSPTMVGVKSGEEVRYFAEIEEAIAFADTIDELVFVLEKDIKELVLPFKREIRIDLNGHSVLGNVRITSPADEKREFGPKLYLTNSKAGTLSRVCGDVIMGDAASAFDGSYLYNGVTISGNVVAQSIDNYGYINCVKSFTDTLTNYGGIYTVLCVEKGTSLVNKTEAKIDTVKENYGIISNTGMLQTIELHKGELQNTYESLFIQEDHPHKISFYDGETLLNSFMVYAESGFMFPYIDISKPGYVFSGWALKNDSTKIYQPGTMSGSVEADQVDYFAMWSKESVSQGTNTPQAPAKTEENKKPTASESEEDKYEITEDDLEEGFDYKGLAYVFVDGDVWVMEGINENAKKITIPSTVTFKGKKFKVTGINEYAFRDFQKLKSVTIGSNVKVIDRYAFYGCEKLKTVKMSKNITHIKANAFENCTALKKITIPSKVKEIGKKAFYKCSSLKTITIKGKSLKKVGKNAFAKLAKKATIKVPKSKKKTYTKLIKVGKGTTIK